MQVADSEWDFLPKIIRSVTPPPIKRYKYDPLLEGQIRLLRLHPGLEDTVLEANLYTYYIQPRRVVPKVLVHPAAAEVDGERSRRTTSEEQDSDNTEKAPKEDDARANLPNYRALSYTWGVEDPRSSIKILARNDSHGIKIKPNLDSALRRLRSDTDYQYLWVDALCINQKDDDEKADQIPMMSDIYHKADEVCIWLGPEDGDSNIAMGFIKQCLQLDDIDRLGRHPRHASNWAALLALMRRPWFNRRWIVQELVRARKATVYCGRKQEDWQDFAAAVSMFAFKQDDIRLSFKESPWYSHHPDYIGDIDVLGAVKLVFAWDNFFRKSESGSTFEALHSLEALMSFLTEFEAKDARDTLYAILWLAKDAKPVSKKKKAWKDYFDSTDRGIIGGGLTETPPATPMRPQASENHFPGFGGQLTPTVSHSHVVEGASGNPFHHRSKDGVLSRMPSQNGDQNKWRAATEDGPGPHAARTSQTVDGGSDGFLQDTNKRVDEKGSSQSIPESRPRMESQQHVGNSVGGDGVSTQDFGSSSMAATTRLHTWRRSSSSLSSHFRVSLSSLPEEEKTREAGQLLKDALLISDHHHIVVDYRKSIFEVCKDFLRLVFRQSNSLDMLCRPWAPDPPESEPRFPSWIAKRSNSPFGISINRVYRRINADPLVGIPGMEQKLYNAHKSIPATRIKINDGKDRSLEVTGVILDVVSEKKGPASEGVIPSDWLDVVGWKPAANHLPPDAFWRTIVANRDANGRRPPFLWKKVCQDAFNRRPRGGDLNTRELLDYDCPSAIRGFLQRVQRVVWKRRLVMLQQYQFPDHLALAPSTTKKGDKICILHGCSVPVVLRQYVNGQPVPKWHREQDCYSKPAVQNSDGMRSIPDKVAPLESEIHYELIGGCYVHGFMDGEAIGLRHKVETFVIR